MTEIQHVLFKKIPLNEAELTAVQDWLQMVKDGLPSPLKEGLVKMINNEIRRRMFEGNTVSGGEWVTSIGRPLTHRINIPTPRRNSNRRINVTRIEQMYAPERVKNLRNPTTGQADGTNKKPAKANRKVSEPSNCANA